MGLTQSAYFRNDVTEVLARFGMKGDFYEVPVLMTIIGGGKAIAHMEIQVSAWAMVYEQVRNDKLALVHA